ncbi:MAG TPA: lecithin retinol acyltransferase family protein [Steroidobacteraceae bacterium]|nr:lecithin retinol acyltransferase family protein [Steroidobacteraceae bacterium]
MRSGAKCYGGGCDHPLADDEEPAVGTHLLTARIGYVHHGIYLGAGKVIHSGAVSGFLPRGPVEEVSLESFSRGRRVWVRLDPPPRFSAEEVVDRARSRLGEDRYHLLRNNCEHFCEWCLRGRERSYQVERLMHWLRPWEHVRRQKIQGASFRFKRIALHVD